MLQALQIRELRLQLLHLGQDQLATGKQHLAAVGQGEAVSLPIEQGLAQLLLHVADHLADGGLGDEQLLGGAGEALLPHQFDKVTQGSDIHGTLVWGDRQIMPIWHIFHNLNSFFAGLAPAYTVTRFTERRPS
ncbi:hypothetical protein D3C85_1031730 [compost metagenome]